MCSTKFIHITSWARSKKVVNTVGTILILARLEQRAHATPHLLLFPSANWTFEYYRLIQPMIKKRGEVQFVKAASS